MATDGFRPERTPRATQNRQRFQMKAPERSRDEPNASERSARRTPESVRRQLPMMGSVSSEDARSAAQGFSNERENHDTEGEDESVAKAAVQGFSNGFVGGVAQDNQGATYSDLLSRFPELRGVEVATGNAAKFPELAGDTSDQNDAAPQPDPEGGYGR